MATPRAGFLSFSPGAALPTGLDRAYSPGKLFRKWASLPSPQRGEHPRVSIAAELASLPVQQQPPGPFGMQALTWMSVRAYGRQPRPHRTAKIPLGRGRDWHEEMGILSGCGKFATASRTARDGKAHDHARQGWRREYACPKRASPSSHKRLFTKPQVCAARRRRCCSCPASPAYLHFFCARTSLQFLHGAVAARTRRSTEVTVSNTAACHLACDYVIVRLLNVEHNHATDTLMKSVSAAMREKITVAWRQWNGALNLAANQAHFVGPPPLYGKSGPH
jgi:hypothetical protein